MLYATIVSRRGTYLRFANPEERLLELCKDKLRKLQMHMTNSLQFPTFQLMDPLDSWLLDSGCAHHLCNDAEMFKFLDDTYKSNVKVGNGEAVDVKGRGTVSSSTISGIKTIPDVLHNLI